tara:strand:- start:3672 stop:4313 length:642 start_codon:yes stop_codon:yes gene_type:complete
MYNVLFSYGKNIELGQCVITAQDDTSMASYWNTTEEYYVDFTTLDMSVGEKLYIDEGQYNIYFARVSAIGASTITLSGNPGQVIYNKVLQKGSISPYIKRPIELYSYPIENYCGASVYKAGHSHRVFAESNPILSDSTLTTTNSIISLYFEKVNNIEEVRIEVKPGSEAEVINSIQKAFREKRDINFPGDSLNINRDIIKINSTISATRNKVY